ncbi:YpdA family putative bacillithiol disulfide reductase [Ornithinibacillus scapharcae]|uniref:YpdA family putative bacillithiol disulfide reductase n=1 Tax=Ornithinibacillus scapharcae TaxID=1147159 RepID=UPI000225BBA3|nr:YpdA family putative bacillithiol disulfide reductase [Ornithinibacillus scapharcae]
MRQKEKVIIVGAGPCGLACSIALQNEEIDALILEKGNVVNSIYHYPTHQTFFSSSEKLEIGGIPFITERQKPVRNQALAYYRNVTERLKLRVNSFEKVMTVRREDQKFIVTTIEESGEEKQYEANFVVFATGYYDQPNYMNVPGENLPKVKHYFKEGHPYYNKNVTVIGGKNSAVDAALELHKAGANITVLYRGETYSKSIKPWILPDFDSLVRKDIIKMVFHAHVKKITDDYVYYTVQDREEKIANDFVFAMTGYRPNFDLIKSIGVQFNEENGKPLYDEATYETNVNGVFVAGVVAAGNNNNEIFIENGRFHGAQIAKAIKQAIS